MKLPFLAKDKEAEVIKQEIINTIKTELKGGNLKMRNENKEPTPAPVVNEVEITQTLLNDKLNYIINVLNKMADKEGLDLNE